MISTISNMELGHIIIKIHYHGWVRGQRQTHREGISTIGEHISNESMTLTRGGLLAGSNYPPSIIKLQLSQHREKGQRGTN